LKVSQFNVYAPSLFEGTTLLYNTLSGSFLALDQAQLASTVGILDHVEDGHLLAASPDPAFAQTLANAGFIIGDNIDERAIVRSRYRGRDSTGNAGISLTIAPTISCNLGCTYCFQEHPNRHMSEENIDAIKRHVSERIEASSGLYVMWFGGEPLIAFKVIRELNEHFTKVCADAGRPYQQSMITNGVLLRDERLDYFRSQKNLSYVQITLDGPPEAHDRRRIPVNGKPTFHTILANIKAAADDLPISIRVNVDRTNAHLLDEFVRILDEEGLRDKVSVYLGHVLPYTTVCESVDSVAFTKEEFAEREVAFQLMLFQRGFRPSVSLPRPKFGNMCVADHPNGAVFAPGNLVFRCWNEVAENADKASDVLGGEADDTQNATRRVWDEYDPFSHEECRTCLVQPLCQGGCPWEARKNPQWSTGHCTTLRFNLPDRLRMFHLMRTIDAHPATDRVPIAIADELQACS
jgi:uncharacterized protein